MTPFASDQWIILVLVFVLGLVIGMYLLAGGKWKRRYREEVMLREEAERRNAELVRERSDLETLRSAATRNPGRPIGDPTPDRGPL